MKRRTRFLPVLWGVQVLFSSASTAQTMLHLNEAVSEAIQNNFSVNIARDSAQIIQNNNTAAGAGLLPQLSLKASINEARNNINQSYSTRADVSQNGAISGTRNASLQLNYLVFNGLRVYATRKRLAELASASKNDLSLRLEQLVFGVVQAYYNLVRILASANAARETLRVNEERVRITQTKFDVGAGNKIDLLQAKVDRNQSRSIILSQQLAFDSARILFNQTLGRRRDSLFLPADTLIEPARLPSYTSLADSAVKYNTALIAAASVTRLAAYAVSSARADLYPAINATAAYQFNRSANSVGLTLSGQSYGPQLGLSLSYNLFNGGLVRRRIQNTEIGLHAAKTGYEQAYLLLSAQLQAQSKNHQNSLAIFSLEEENVAVARENLSISLAKFRLGASTQLELITAEQSLESSLNRLVLARFRIKISETALLRLSGLLLRRFN